jgi:hypothetical protein
MHLMQVLAGHQRHLTLQRAMKGRDKRLAQYNNQLQVCTSCNE